MMVGIDVDVDVDIDIGVVDVIWHNVGLESSDMNLPVISDRLCNCYSNHLRLLRKHLYLDRNQTIGELEPRRYSTQLVCLFSMMKLLHDEATRHDVYVGLFEIPSIDEQWLIGSLVCRKEALDCRNILRPNLGGIVKRR
jgi:hypothetical protein